MFCSQLAFSILEVFGLHFGPDVGSLLYSFGPLGVPWGLQVDPQGVLEGVLDTTQFQTAKHFGKVIFGGARGGQLDGGPTTRAWVLDTLGPLGRVPACTGAHLLIFGSAEG